MVKTIVILLTMYFLILGYIGYKSYKIALDEKNPNSIINSINGIDKDADTEIP